MPNIWKNVSFALSAMIVGSLVTAVVLTMPGGPRGDVTAQDNGLFSGRRTPMVNQQNLTHATGLSTAFRNVAEALRPSVVSISTRQTQIVRGRRLPPGLPPELGELFGGMENGAPRVRDGMGSGVIVRPDGYILTNNHVVEDADELTVELADGRKVIGTIVGTDPATDLAVVKIDAPELSAATIGSSDEIRVGDWVLAIGSPFGLDQTVTAGIISGKNRVQEIVDDGEGFEDFLQTDAAINPGNSGGALVNLRGELVGINTAILSRSGASAGIGFAIPVSLAAPVLESIIETGTVRRGFLGASVLKVTPQAVKEYALKVNSGAMIGSLLEDQPADNAGLQPGDVVTQIDGRPCRSDTQLRNYVASQRPGSTITMAVNRDGKSMQIRVKLGERTAESTAMFSTSGGYFGAKLAPLTPELARQYGYANLRNGLIVTSVKDNSLAQEYLKPGDVIVRAGNIPLTTVEQLQKVFEEAKRQNLPLRLLIRSGDEVKLLPVL